MISVNEVYDTLAKALPNVYVTKYYNRITEQLPCVYFRESHSPVRRYNQLDYQDEQHRLVCYVEVYGYDTDDIVTTIESTFKSMYFLEELAEMIPNYDPDIERVSLRFQRIITDGDTLPAQEVSDNGTEENGNP